MIWTFLILLFGLAGVLIGADIIVNAAIRVAKSLNMSQAFIGLTILSIGTSLPEIFTHIFSSIEVRKGVTEAAGLAVGTNIGSNIIQITLILGVIGLFSTLRSSHTTLKRDYIIMLVGIVLLWIVSFDGFIGKIEGGLLAILYIIYLVYLGRNEKIKEVNNYKTNYWWDGGLLIIGFSLLLFCATIVINKALLVADILGVTGTFVGTLIIGVATALPELTTAIVALLKKSADMSLGTLIGSNITNPMFALGIGAVISGYPVVKSIVWFDIPFWFLVSFMGLLFFWKKMELKHWEAGIMAACYFLFVGFQLWVFA
jgi:cation:H+ antiporter